MAAVYKTIFMFFHVAFFILFKKKEINLIWNFTITPRHTHTLFWLQFQCSNFIGKIQIIIKKFVVILKKWNF